MSELLTLPKVARLLSIGLTTLRYRVSQCEEFIPFQRQGKYKVYDNAAIQIIQHINKLYEDGKDVAEILPILDSQYDRQIVIQEEQAIQTINEQHLMSIEERLTFLLEQFIERIDERNEVVQRQQEQRIEHLERELIELKQHMQQTNKSWWKKIFR